MKRKNRFFATIIAFAINTLISQTASAINHNSPGKPISNLHLQDRYFACGIHNGNGRIGIRTGIDIYYTWVLFGNGCFYLYRVEVVDNILEFWTPMGPGNWATNYINCAYTDEQMDNLC